ncbi:hypothetical protein [Mesobacillus jeotgali]|uniref:hypothetical protein n=1 Tax=Mesobacillus jeotgali TaxID=129985 RepID=UPI001CFDB2D9|nr:hypothetical protein [Mesobacillus jeotgali]
MNENEFKPHIDPLKKDPSLNEIFNFTQEIIKKLPEDTNEKANENSNPTEKNQLNADTLNSLVTAAQSFVNPTTLSLLSKALKQSENKDDNREIPNLKLEVEQLSDELSEVKEELNQTKTQLAEKIHRLEELETTVQYLKRRRRR